MWVHFYQKKIAHSIYMPRENMKYTQQNSQKNYKWEIEMLFIFSSDRHFLMFYSEHILKPFKSLLIYVYEKIIKLE